MAGDLTPGQVRQWDASAIQQVFQVVKNRDGTYKDFGDTLGSVQQQLSDWGGGPGMRTQYYNRSLQVLGG